MVPEWFWRYACHSFLDVKVDANWAEVVRAVQLALKDLLRQYPEPLDRIVLLAVGCAEH